MSAGNLGKISLGKKAHFDLDTVKRQSLVAYAESIGFERDPKLSNGSYTCLRAGSEKINVRRSDGIDVYCSAHDPSDSGTIIDFAMRRFGLSFQEALRELAEKSASFPIESFQPKPIPEPAGDYRKKAAAVWASKERCTVHPYLISRGIPATVLTDPRFLDCWRGGSHGVVVFPHIDRGQPRLCGYELRGPATKGFGKGTRKGLWVSANARTASQIVICEGPIDCLSHAALFPGDAAYAAFGGGLGRNQIDLLSGLISKAVDRGATVVIAVDYDAAGDDYAKTIAGLTALPLERMKPIGKDWNDQLVGGGVWN